MKLFSRKNLALSFEDMKHKETFMPDFSGLRGRRYKYETHVKCGGIIEVSGASTEYYWNGCGVLWGMFMLFGECNDNSLTYEL
jgi:hypothetical protein